ncbi:hypothetical protein MXMO3_00947 [Maritalea myrionectae]|uniref:Uncharacterized protein n=1 Tax=Maritalea myrionectae TaxID=454601 RepID=A0A2R4MBR6_9HYPH|nr:Arm DNA-binding domain-containing protein [Maritalea myrionectae]AVX03478.1 hypothetical protein MXMO3_00947 [Maritalea myrionectae]
MNSAMSFLTGFIGRASNVSEKVFYLNTRINGRARRTKIGDYPLTSLAEARRRPKAFYANYPSAHIKTAALAHRGTPYICSRRLSTSSLGDMQGLQPVK